MELDLNPQGWDSWQTWRWFCSDKEQTTDTLITKKIHQSVYVKAPMNFSVSLQHILLNKCMQILHWIILAPVSSICLFSCPVPQSSILRNKQKQYSNLETDEDKWSYGALFWLFSLCQFRDSAVDSRRTCYCAVTICHFCTVIVSFCVNATELIWAESSRTERSFIWSGDGEYQSVVLRFVTVLFLFV